MSTKSADQLHDLAERGTRKSDLERGSEAAAPTLQRSSSTSSGSGDKGERIAEALHFDGYDTAVKFWDRLRGKGREVPGWWASAKNAVLSSCASAWFSP